jgi:DNA-binding phage protein
MTIEITDWNIQDHLHSPERMLGYLEAAFEDGDPELIAVAIEDVAKARGVTLSPALSASSDVGSLIRAIKALGLELTPKLAA